jgi:chemotaxis response regulator CheB
MRAQEMQKMHMTINHKLYSKQADNSNSKTKIQLSLVGSSLGGVDSLTRLIAAIENNVLGDFNWIRVG